jgi:hypothetical protein
MAKKFYLQGSEIKGGLLPIRIGGCIATDMITVHGKKVGRMWRDKPHRPESSGWSFCAGTEDQAYFDNVKNLDVYDVNTIANYDPEIIPFLYSAIGSEFERDATGKFVPYGASRQSGYAEGRCALDAGWSIELPLPCCSRVERGSLVLWRTGLTLWISVQLDPKQANADTLLNNAIKEMSPEAQDVELANDGELSRLSYVVRETDPNRPVPNYCCLMSHTFTNGNWLMIGIYCDTLEALAHAKSIHLSIRKI